MYIKPTAAGSNDSYRSEYIDWERQFCRRRCVCNCNVNDAVELGRELDRNIPRNYIPNQSMSCLSRPDEANLNTILTMQLFWIWQDFHTVIRLFNILERYTFCWFSLWSFLGTNHLIIIIIIKTKTKRFLVRSQRSIKSFGISLHNFPSLVGRRKKKVTRKSRANRFGQSAAYINMHGMIQSPSIQQYQQHRVVDQKRKKPREKIKTWWRHSFWSYRRSELKAFPTWLSFPMKMDGPTNVDTYFPLVFFPSFSLSTRIWKPSIYR